MSDKKFRKSALDQFAARSERRAAAQRREVVEELSLEEALEEAADTLLFEDVNVSWDEASDALNVEDGEYVRTDLGWVRIASPEEIHNLLEEVPVEDLIKRFIGGVA